MPILKRLKNLEWATLIIELILIFVGITAALWFDNMNQGREEREREASVLLELEAALRADTADLNLNLRSSARTLLSIDTVLARLSSSAPYDPTLAGHFSRATVATNFLPNSAAYEYLKSLGLGILSNDSLRLQVTQYYEVQTQYLTKVEGLFVNGNWEDAVKPEMLRKFEYRFLFEPAVPLDYASLTRDRHFQTMLATTREIMEWKDEISRETLGQAESLLEGIARELAAR